MITITQIDIAVLRVIYSEITIIIIRLLLNEKEFINDNDLSKNLLQNYNLKNNIYLIKKNTFLGLNFHNFF